MEYHSPGGLSTTSGSPQRCSGESEGGLLCWSGPRTRSTRCCGDVEGRRGSNRESVSGCHPRNDEESFQKRKNAEHVQNGLGCNFPAIPCLFQSQVYEVRGSKLIEGDGVRAHEQFAKRRQALPKFTGCLPLILPPTYLLGAYLKPLHGSPGKCEQLV